MANRLSRTHPAYTADADERSKRLCQVQRRGVIVHSIVAAGTIDRRVAQALARKDATQGALLDALKEYRGERL